MSLKKVVGVYSIGDSTARLRLLGALEEAFPVTFRLLEGAIPSQLDGALFFTQDPVVLERCERNGTPLFVASETRSGGPHAVAQSIQFSADPKLDQRLRGQILLEESLPSPPPYHPEPGDLILATCQDVPIWVRRPRGPSYSHHVAFAPKEIQENEVLRHHLQGNCFARLLPLIHFLREITHEIDWTPPPLRANIHIDDPNLHRPTYGFVNYGHLAEHAKRHHYHISMATIPLDGWFAHPEPVKVFQENRDVLSLLMHGNDHTKAELGRPMTEVQAVSLLSQALRRVQFFEDRYRIRVSRIQVPPGEILCSEDVLRAMSLVGLEGCTNSRPYMWRCKYRLENIPTDKSLACFWPAEMVAGGFPIFRRIALEHAIRKPWQKAEVVLSAFLNQPIIIVAGHHTDLRGGLDSLEEAAGWINSLGSVSWLAMEDIARSNYLHRLENDTLHLRLFSRLIHTQVPTGVARIRVERTPMHGFDEGDLVTSMGSQQFLSTGGSVDLHPPYEGLGADRLEISLRHPKHINPNATEHPPRSVWPYFRRVLTEFEHRFVDAYCVPRSRG